MSFLTYFKIPTLVRRCSTDFQKLREKYFKLEKCWEAVADLSSMTRDELAIHDAHKNASYNCHFSYQDPNSGEKVFTRYYHFLNGKCCGEACRHCTYNYDEVPENLKRQKKFNGSFWVDVTNPAEIVKKQIEKLKNMIKVKPRKLSSYVQTNPKQ
ncbi:uncharacterized protein [Halyomorpha halys]|uniref:uncharacterized protein n=1 Tax=Halyomorpha halys TaxID=286706 RepID=UPI0006D50944|nr:uncharacterized protein LOC106680212 [Halyomorpha halys]